MCRPSTLEVQPALTNALREKIFTRTAGAPTCLVRTFLGVARFINDVMVLENDGVFCGEVRPAVFGFTRPLIKEVVRVMSGVELAVAIRLAAIELTELVMIRE